jgi:hypothetical protein
MTGCAPDPDRTAHERSEETRGAVEQFLASSRQPVLIEAGEDPLPVTRETFAINARGGFVVIECWNATRNLVRRVRGIVAARRGMLELEIERFGSRTGKLALIDLADPSNRDAGKRGARLKYRERFRRSLRRQFPNWRIAELSVETDLHHSLSPSYPRALLRKGIAGIAAIGADENALSPEGALSFGLIWLDYLRRREAPNPARTRPTGLSIEGLAIFVPVGAEATTCHRVRHLNPEAARYWTFVHGPGGDEDLIDPGDYTNFDTHLPLCRSPLAESRPELLAWVDRIAGIDGVQKRENMDGSVTLAVRGLEFARAVGDELRFGIDTQHSGRHVAGIERHIAEIEQLAVGLAAMRHGDAGDRMNPLYLRHPEAWLESQVRDSIEQLDATLFSTPLYGQVPHFAAGERSVMDVLAVNRDGVLVVIELKASQDIHLPLQALDYWMRVKWHLDRGEFQGRGYFPGIELRRNAPKLLLVAPALDFHPSNETILRFFSKEVQVERVGVGIEWKRDLRVMFRVPSSPCPNPYFAR